MNKVLTAGVCMHAHCCVSRELVEHLDKHPRNGQPAAPWCITHLTETLITLITASCCSCPVARVSDKTIHAIISVERVDKS